MYHLYDGSNGGAILLRILGIFLTGVGVVVLLPPYAFEPYGMSVLAAVFCFAAAAVLYGMAYRFSYHYENIKLLKLQNPELVKLYEKDFKRAEQVGQDVWIGEKFFFLVDASGLQIYEFSELKNLQIYKHMIHGGTWVYRMESLDADKRFSVRLLEKRYSEENALIVKKIVERIVVLSGASCCVENL